MSEARGWGWPEDAIRCHYFIDGESLCGFWYLAKTSLYKDREVDETSDDCCKVCLRKLQRLRQRERICHG